MERESFKQRMKNLKSYRENNPDKGYWDWKVLSYKDGGELTDHPVNKPIIPEYTERVVNGKPWSLLTPKELFMNRVGYDNGRPLEEGLDIVSPEFDMLTLGRSIATLPKKFLGSSAAIKDVPGNYYRQLGKSSKGIESAKETGMVSVNSNVAKKVTYTTKTGRTFNFNKKFDVPFWAKDKKWYGDTNKMDVIVSKGDKGLDWKPITQHGGFTSAEKAGSRRTPVFNGEINNTPADLFEYYRHYPGIGFRNVTEGYPHLPVTSLNTISENIELYKEGGEVGDPKKEEFYKKTGRSTTGRPLEEGLKPAFNLEDFANFTPVGDALSVKDTYDSVRLKDWLGTGLGVAGMLPFVPNLGKKAKGVIKKVWRETPSVNKEYVERLINSMDGKAFNNRRLVEEYIELRNRAYELMNTPEARRRAQKIDSQYGTEYTKVYDDYTRKYEDIDEYSKLPDPEFADIEDAYARVIPTKSNKIQLSKDLIKSPEDYTDGLIRHEIGHLIDNAAYPGGIPNNAYLRELGKPSKYKPFEEVVDLMNTNKDKLEIYNYLRTPTEKKSIMNEFDEYLMNNYGPLSYPSTSKLFKEAIELAPDTQKRMKNLLKIHVKPNVLFKDFMKRPLVSKDNDKNLV